MKVPRFVKRHSAAIAASFAALCLAPLALVADGERSAELGFVGYRGTDSSMVQLADGAELDLSANQAPFVQTASTKFLGEVKVRLPGDGNSHGHKRVIAWDAPPSGENVTFAAVGNTKPVRFLVEGDGLYTESRFMVIYVR